MNQQAKHHKLFRKHRIVLWEDEGTVNYGKIVDSTINKVGVTTNLKVGEICMFKRDPNATEGIKRGRVWLRHVITMDVSDTLMVPISWMRLPSKDGVDHKIYNKYRK
jgi:hypothetical protein